MNNFSESNLSVEQINASFKESILAKFPIKKLKKGTSLYRSGDTLKSLFFIVSGRVRISQPIGKDKDQTNNILMKGDFLGEEVFFDNKKVTQNAYTFVECEVIEMPIQELMKIPNILVFTNSLLTQKLETFKYRLSTIANKDSKSRIIDFIENLVNTKGKKIGFEYVVYDFMTHNDIAGITSTSRQTVTTVLNELKRNDIITFNRRRLIVRDMSALQNF